ncbi:Flagellar basal-body rod protein FlgB [Olavius sp. associated proteobacterium Delta 1]|nr:Flagellar basal-body rod protein FlgB [Olavius sp. associated proteobacterium Delta 1]
MPTDGIFDRTISLLERSLNLRSLNQRVLASNIANMDTPNYKAVELIVAEEMNRKEESNSGISLVRTHVNHLPIKNKAMNTVKLKAAKAPDFSIRGDGNTVDIDRTMGRLAKNTLLFNAATQLISNKFKGLKNAMKGGN